LGAVILTEDLSTSMATAAFLAFMASMTNKKFTATQYALLSSLTGIPRVILSSPTGYVVETLGWFNFYVLCTLIAIPGLLMIRSVQKLTQQK
jgi:PAT family beta-lactamase induction signal transducer AmpG